RVVDGAVVVQLEKAAAVRRGHFGRHGIAERPLRAAERLVLGLDGIEADDQPRVQEGQGRGRQQLAGFQRLHLEACTARAALCGALPLMTRFFATCGKFFFASSSPPVATGGLEEARGDGGGKRDLYSPQSG